MGWSELVAIVHSINKPERRITCIVHPEATGIVDCPKFGGIRTERGPAGYMVSIAEKAKDEQGNELPFVHHRTERVTV
jgi:hypothetical protein